MNSSGRSRSLADVSGLPADQYAALWERFPDTAAAFEQVYTVARQRMREHDLGGLIEDIADAFRRVDSVGPFVAADLLSGRLAEARVHLLRGRRLRQRLWHRLRHPFSTPKPGPTIPLREASGLTEEQFASLWRADPVITDSLALAHAEAQRYLLPADRDRCLDRIHDAVRRAAMLDETEAEPRRDLLERRLAEAREFIRTAGARRVLREYSNGMYRGVLASVGVLMLIGGIAAITFGLFYPSGDANVPDQTILALAQSLVCIGGGATGATLSVLIRTRRADELDYRASGTSAATVRIMLGWFFAAGALALIRGGIIDIFNVPDNQDDVTAWFFWGAVGFLAGFNERWALDLVTRHPTEPPPGERSEQPRTQDAATSEPAHTRTRPGPKNDLRCS